jgi:hypothetical protein
VGKISAQLSKPPCIVTVLWLQQKQTKSKLNIRFQIVIMNKKSLRSSLSISNFKFVQKMGSFPLSLCIFKMSGIWLN